MKLNSCLIKTFRTDSSPCKVGSLILRRLTTPWRDIANFNFPGFRKNLTPPADSVYIWFSLEKSPREDGGVRFFIRAPFVPPPALWISGGQGGAGAH